MRGEFDYIDEGFNVRTVWDSNDIPIEALEVVRFSPTKPEGMTRTEECNHFLEVQIEYARIRRMVSGEDDWVDDLEFELDIPEDDER